MTSLWFSERAQVRWTASTLSAGQSADVVVVGAGITGLVTAELLARAGKSVLVLEARTLGAGTTGNTTAKISLLQGTHLSKMIARHGTGLAKAYVDGNREGQEWIRQYCEMHGIATQFEDAYTYAQSGNGVPAARAELLACEAVGLPAKWDDDADVPFPYHGGVRLPDQLQFNPIPFLDSLASELLKRGGRVVENARVRSVSVQGKGVTLTVIGPDGEDVDIRAQQLVLATGIPILDRGGFFARLKPHRSYCLAFKVPGEITRPMMISSDSPTRSVRYAPTFDGELLIVGGGGHPVGRQRHPSGPLKELTTWTRLHYPGAEQTHFWSAQDYTPADHLPYVGPILPGNKKVFVATGFDKWGMTNGVAAGLALSSHILGGRMDWAHAFASWSPHELTGITTMLLANLEVGFNLAKGWVTPVTRTRRRDPSDGDGGVVSGPPWHLEGRCKVDGTQHAVSPVCTHLGGIVNWNDADKAWECPLHGSRFAPDGTLLEGPATRDLTRSQ
jgi:glycine/D-amino acid oxidase-like deaminating enzyme